MSVRGEYRPIYEALWDGPDFQALTPFARLVLLALKGKLGCAGIRAVPGFMGALEEWTGLRADAIGPAIAELRDSGWVETERSVVWVVRGLEFEPTVTAANPKHRRHIEKLVAALPRLAIVSRFVTRYSQWVSDGVSKAFAVPMPITTPPLPLPPPLVPRVPRSKKPDRVPAPDVSPRGGWVGEATGIWLQHVGAVKPGRLGNAVKPLVDAYGWDTPTATGPPVKPVLECYCRWAGYKRRNGRFPDKAEDAVRDLTWVKPENLAATFQEWADMVKPMGQSA